MYPISRILICPILLLAAAPAFAQAPMEPAPPPPPAGPAEPTPPPAAEPTPPPPPPPAEPAPPPPAPPPPEAAPPPATLIAPAPAPAPAAPAATHSVASKFATSFYGFVEFDTIGDSTQSFNDLAGNAQIARAGTYAHDHGRLTFGVRNSRLGFKFKGPETEDVKTSAIAEMDFLGNQPSPVSEAAFFQNPTFRIRHMALKLETPVIDVLAGQYWQLFGWQSYFHPNTVEIQGVPGQIYSRAPQLRLSHVFKSDPVNVEIAVAAARPPQRDSMVPDGQGGLKLSVNDWKGVHTAGSTGTAADPLAIGVSGVVRQFELPEFAAAPPLSPRKGKTGWGFSADALIPVVPATVDHRENAMTVTGSFVIGSGISDLYTGLTGGAGFPSLPNPTMASPAPSYTPDVDSGMVTFDSAGNLRTIDWESFIVGAQYYLPPSGNVWISGNFSWMKSNNLASGITSASSLAKLDNKSQWADGNLFWDVNQAVRIGAEYAWFHQNFADGGRSTNHRVQVSFFYIF